MVVYRDARWHFRSNAQTQYRGPNLTQPHWKPMGFQFPTKCFILVELGQVVDPGY